MMKLEHGSSAIGACVVRNSTQLVEQMERIQEDLRQNSDFPGIGLGHSNAVMVSLNGEDGMLFSSKNIEIGKPDIS